MRTLGRLLTAPGRWWSRSLSFKLVSSTLVAMIVLVAISSVVLVRQVTDGILGAKLESSKREASVVVTRSQERLNRLPGQGSVEAALENLARTATSEGLIGTHFEFVIAHGDHVHASDDVGLESVPDSLRQTLQSEPRQLASEGTDILRDGTRSPGLAVGSTLEARGVRYPIFFLFDTSQEMGIVHLVQRVSLISALIFAVLAAVITYLISRSVLGPIKQARQAAERMASGHFEERLSAGSEDDLGGLSRSLNHMATELSRKIREFEDLSRVQRRFVSDVSHELRTPLTTVRMAAEMMMEGREQFDTVTRRSVELLNRELDRFEGLLTDLLEISRFDAGAAELTLEDVDLVELVRGEIEAQAGLAARYSVEIVLDAPPQAMCQCDQRRVRRILSNLLSNAIEHGEARPVSVHVRATDEAVAIAVRDRGIGFTATQAHQVFARFWRADPSRQRTVGGNGLGLSIALEDAQLHGGWLNAWGRPGQGAQFRLTLPRRARGRLVKSPWPVVPPREPDEAAAPERAG